MTGKEKCEFLREIRKNMAQANGIPYEPRECNFEGECSGTCPFCEKEAADLLSALKEKERQGVEIKRDELTTMLLDNEKMDFNDAREAMVSEVERLMEMTESVGIIRRDEEVIDPQRREFDERVRRMKEQERPLMGDIDEKSYFDPKEEELIREEKRRLNFYNRKIKPFLESLFGSPLRGEVEF